MGTHWEALHAIITNGQWRVLPDGDVRLDVITGGRLLDINDEKWPEYRILLCDEVSRVNDFLVDLNVELLIAETDFDLLRSMDVYRCDDFEDEYVSTLKEYLVHDILPFYQNAASQNLAVLSWVG